MKETTYYSRPIFSVSDYERVHDVILQLPKREFLVVWLHFWGQFSLCEIAQCFGVDWTTVNKTLECAVGRLRAICMSDPHFDRYWKTSIAA